MFFMAGLQRGLASCCCHRWPGGAAARVTPSCRSGLSVPVCSLQSRDSCRTTGQQLVSDLYCSIQAGPGEGMAARRAWAWSWGLARGRRGAGRTRPGRLRRHKPRSPGLQAGRPKCHSTYCALHGWHFGEGRARLMRTSRALGSRHGKTSSLIHNH